MVFIEETKKYGQDVLIDVIILWTKFYDGN